MQEPAPDCGLCPRLATFRAENQNALPGYHNAPVAAFGSDAPELLIVGLAPGLHGANQTGRPFTGDYAGDLLYPTLLRFGFADGVYGRGADDGLQLIKCRITNAVRCVPPANKPESSEISNCRSFLADEIASLRPSLRIIVALGTIAHNSVLKVFELTLSAHRFGHGAEHALGQSVTLIDSYHCSRYNTNTGRLTRAMFAAIFLRARALLG